MAVVRNIPFRRAVDRYRNFWRVDMFASRISISPRIVLLGCALLSATSIGCQSTIGGQTLPSAFYLQDDVQYFPAGPEFRLSRQVQAIEQYNLRRQGLAEPEPAPEPGPQP